ncbi:hypothetical protein SALBM311S_01598 [Streptomyces alboniger]
MSVTNPFMNPRDLHRDHDHCDLNHRHRDLHHPDKEPRP